MVTAAAIPKIVPAVDKEPFCESVSSVSVSVERLKPVASFTAVSDVDGVSASVMLLFSSEDFPDSPVDCSFVVVPCDELFNEAFPPAVEAEEVADPADSFPPDSFPADVWSEDPALPDVAVTIVAVISVLFPSEYPLG